MVGSLLAPDSSRELANYPVAELNFDLVELLIIVSVHALHMLALAATTLCLSHQLLG